MGSQIRRKKKRKLIITMKRKVYKYMGVSKVSGLVKEGEKQS